MRPNASFLSPLEVISRVYDSAGTSKLCRASSHKVTGDGEAPTEVRAHVSHTYKS